MVETGPNEQTLLQIYIHQGKPRKTNSQNVRNQTAVSPLWVTSICRLGSSVTSIYTSRIHVQGPMKSVWEDVHVSDTKHQKKKYKKKCFLSVKAQDTFLLHPRKRRMIDSHSIKQKKTLIIYWDLFCQTKQKLRTPGHHFHPMQYPGGIWEQKQHSWFAKKIRKMIVLSLQFDGSPVWC